MRERIVEVLEKNKVVNRLLEEFKNDFLEKYIQLEDNKKKLVEDYKEGVFKNWLNSPIIDESYITPNYIINIIAKHKVKGNYTISPNIKINKDKNNNLEFKVTWVYYATDSVPVLMDLEELIKYVDPTLVIREGNEFLLDNGEEIANKLTFRSNMYIDYLINIGTEIGIFQKMRSIGCETYILSDKYQDYVKLSNKDKIKLIIKCSINYANNNLNEIPYAEYIFNGSKNIALDLLDNDIDNEYYCKNIPGMANEMRQFIDDKDVIEEMNKYESAFNDDMIVQVIKDEIGIYVDWYILSVFGDYLGIINYTYEEFFLMDLLIELMVGNEDGLPRVSTVNKLDAIHNLTSIGTIYMKEFKKKFNKNQITDVLIKDIEGIIDLHNMEKMEIYQVLMNDFDMFTEYDDDIIPIEILKHVEEFECYLQEVKGLKEKTCEKHIGNIVFFLNNGLGYSTLVDIKNIDENEVDFYLAEWFMDKVATSKNSINEQITSISQYTKFLENKEYIDKQTAKDIKSTIKNKERYYEIFRKLEEELENSWLY